MSTLMSMAPTINTTTPEASEAWHNVAWMEQAACTTHDPELWFSHNDTEAEAALVVCRSCPVMETCLEDVMQEEGGKGPQSRFGIRGGLLPNERHNLRVRRYKAGRGGAA